MKRRVRPPIEIGEGERAAMIKAYQRPGATIASVRAEFNRGICAVNDILRTAGPRKSRGRPASEISEREQIAIIRAYLRPGATIASVRAEFGHGMSKINDIVRAAGLTSGEHERRGRKPKTAETIRMQAARDAGATLQEIAADYGITRQAVEQRLARHAAAVAR